MDNDRSFAHQRDLAGRRVIITGATAGLGRALLDELTARGATVGFVARRRESVEATERAVPGSVGVVADVSRQEDIHPATIQLTGRLGGVDVLVHNASSLGPVPLRTLAELLLERHGIVTREHVKAEGIAGGFSTLYDSFGALETLGVCRRGYFVEGLGGAQFALPGAVERLRGQSVPQVHGPDGTVSAVDHLGRELPATTLDATDPAQPYGTLLPWPELPTPRSDRERDDDAESARGRLDEARDAAGGYGRTAHLERPSTATPPRPQRAQGARVVLVGPDPVLFVDRSGKALQVLTAYDDPRLPLAFAALVEAVQTGKAGSLPRKGLQLERIDGLEVIGHPLEPLLVPAGFRSAPTKYLARA